MRTEDSVRPLIAIVGVCASGKSTLAESLRRLGYNARQVSQEHSYVPDMWLRITRPDLLVFLDCTVATTRSRRGSDIFPDWLLDEELRRLRHAREHCDIYVATDFLSPDEVTEIVIDRLGTRLGPSMTG